MIPPKKIKTFLRAKETEELITERIRVVSVVNRDNTSPVKIFSKKGGLMLITRLKTADLISATNRSPILVTS